MLIGLLLHLPLLVLTKSIALNEIWQGHLPSASENATQTTTNEIQGKKFEKLNFEKNFTTDSNENDPARGFSSISSSVEQKMLDPASNSTLADSMQPKIVM